MGEANDPFRAPSRDEPPTAISQVNADGKETKTGASSAPAAGPLPSSFGRYRIVRELGRGGMGAVYLAHDTQLDRPVALKVPHFTAKDGPELMERFHREARAAATLDHPNICPVYDVGEVGGVHYLTMAYVEVRPLVDLLQ